MAGEKTPNNNIISLSMFPAISPLRLKRQFENITKLLSEATDKQVVFQTRKDYPGYYNAVKNEKFDLAIVTAFDYVRIRKDTNYIPILSRVDTSSTKLITTNMAIKDIKSLADKKIGFAPESAGISVMGKYLLARNNLPERNYESIFFDNQLSCVQALISEKVDACFVADIMLNEILKYLEINYSVLITFRPDVKQLMLVHPRIEGYLNKVKEALLALNATKEGRDILAEAYLFELDEFDGSRYDIYEEMLNYLNQSNM
ncbi:MAG: phosphate/phosphite/phosphonate ABC transporter substrate-binding protein [Cellvibrionaceae bacterium]